MNGKTVISVDVMGGDHGPGPFVMGMARALKTDPSLYFIVHGDEAQLLPLLRRRPALRERTEIRHTADVVSMNEKPSRALRVGRNSSLNQALQSVAGRQANVALSAGNTGALVAMSMMTLRRAPGVDRPAIAVHWPSANANGYNIALDMGADIRADPDSLLQFAVMGAEYARLSAGIERPRIGLLNVGSEDFKGRAELHEARALIAKAQQAGMLDFDFIGFVEGNDIPTNRVDVIVTDGFAGNIALKAAEGTASFIRQALKQAFRYSIISRIGLLFALGSLRRLRMRIDPRRVNGGVFLGLNGIVVKSHGGADAIGFASAIHLAAKLATSNFPDRVAACLAKIDKQRLTECPSNTTTEGKQEI